MIKIMFVCHGNICRSPMAEFIMKKLVDDMGLSSEFHIVSSATSTEEIGNPVYPPARAELAGHGIGCSGKTAVQLKKSDYVKYDYFIGMDERNVYNMKRIFNGDSENKVYLLLSFAGKEREVADPYWTGDFSATEKDVVEGLNAFYKYLKEKGEI